MNISLQVLDGIACHNGEVELEEYIPAPMRNFEELEAMLESCYRDQNAVRKLMPCTLEGAVVRISDIIAYLGKDRQDAARIGIQEESGYRGTRIGSINAEIINNLVVNIIENSYGKPYIRLDAEHFKAMQTAKAENYARIYINAAKISKLADTVKPMMADIYGQMLEDLQHNRRNSPIFTDHIDYVNRVYYKRDFVYEQDEPNQLVVDYIASMTDDYLIDLHRYLFPSSPHAVRYTGYFDQRGERNV